jgi:putative ATP-dependent endonuclease of the OLD family
VKVRLLEIENFRGVTSGRIVFRGNTLLVGGNNVGKSTVCEALDLVLGPERLFRRPAVDEHDFFAGNYLDAEGTPTLITVRAVLTDLSDETVRRFADQLRRWDDEKCVFIDEEPAGVERADGEGIAWALPVIFRARYDRAEDEFEAGTFFDHPVPDPADLDEEQQASLGQGRRDFTRSHKRLCGFVYLRALRTGSRALGLQRGSLLDTILKLGGDGAAEMWLDTLKRLRELDPSVGDIEQLKEIRSQVRERMGQFVNLAQGDDAASFFASDLTRTHLREVVRLFIATGPSDHPVPFSRQGAGSLNLLVFALLTIIAELKGTESVIFAMEEPEIALPPHTQRRVTRHVLQEMGQTIVTSHSPYVIEQFDPKEVVMLCRSTSKELLGTPIDTHGIKPKTYRAERRQFAEAILSNAVIVVEGSTEASLLPVASGVLEGTRPDEYTHLDLAGISIFEASGDGDVPRFGPIFRALDKTPFGIVDKQSSAPTEDVKDKCASFEEFWESPEEGVERLLTQQMPTAVLRRFLAEVSMRSDYPSQNAPYSPGATDDEVRDVAFNALKARKGHGYGYAALLIEQCQTEAELPEFLRTVLLTIDEKLRDISEHEPELSADPADLITVDAEGGDDPTG